MGADDILRDLVCEVDGVPLVRCDKLAEMTIDTEPIYKEPALNLTVSCRLKRNTRKIFRRQFEAMEYRAGIRSKARRKANVDGR